MTILHTLQWTQFAGTEKVCVDLCNEFSKEHQVYLLSSNEIGTYIDKKVNLIEIDFKKSRFNLMFLYKISKIINKMNPDIIHVHNTKELEIIYYARFFLKKKIPIVGTRHNPVLKKRFAFADLGVAVSEETKLYTNAKKNIVILNGIPYKEPKFIENIKNTNTFNLVAVGRLAPVKGFHILIKALSLVDFEYKLNIIGEGQQRGELEDLINSLELCEKIKLLGFVSNTQDYIYSSDAQIISSTEEGFSLALIEAIFYSSVLIASDIANHKDLLGEELVYENTLENLVSKLNEIYKDYNKYQKLFAKAKNKKDEYSIENTSQKYLEAYKMLTHLTQNYL